MWVITVQQLSKQNPLQNGMEFRLNLSHSTRFILNASIKSSWMKQWAWAFHQSKPSVLSFYNSFEPMFILMNSPIFHIKATLQTKWLICVLINFMNIENDLVDIDVAEVVCCLLLLLCSSFDESSPCKSVQKIHPRMNRQRLKTQSIYIDSVVMICGQWNFRIICCFGNERCKY